MGDWGFAPKDFVYAGSAIFALVTSAKRLWVWKVELDTCRSDFQAQLDAANTRHKEELAQLRADMRLTIESEKARGDKLWDLLLDGRSLVRKSVEATAKLAERQTAQ